MIHKLNFYIRSVYLMEKKILINGAFYIVLTTFFLVLWIKEKQIGGKIKEYRAAFSENIVTKLNVTNPKVETGIKKTVDIVDTNQIDNVKKKERKIN